MDNFQCKKCNRLISLSKNIGTLHRNHCPYCLYSVDVDSNSGDRKSKCKGIMSPIGLTFKKEGKDKYGNPRQGELMIIHFCQKCEKISINRIAGDDNPDSIIEVFKKSQLLDSFKLEKIKENNIDLLNKKNEKEILRQIFGDKI